MEPERIVHDVGIKIHRHGNNFEAPPCPECGSAVTRIEMGVRFHRCIACGCSWEQDAIRKGGK